MAEGEINIDNIIQRLLEGKMLHENNADEVPSINIVTVVCFAYFLTPAP